MDLVTITVDMLLQEMVVLPILDCPPLLVVVYKYPRMMCGP